MKQQEEQLIRNVLKGDTSSFSYFVDAYQNMAYTIAFRICKNKQDAEDIVQESFVRAFNNLRTFRFTSKFSTWFYRIVYNTAISSIQTASYRNEFTEYGQIDTDVQFSDLNILEHMEISERKQTINDILNHMPTDESIVLTLFYLEEHSIKDVSEMLSITESNVKVRLHRARKRFAEMASSMSLQTL